MVLNLEVANRTPLVEQIVTALRRQVSDALPSGTRIPSIRAFARTHGIRRFTVAEAYDGLVAMGSLEARRGSGFYTTHAPGTQPWSAADTEPPRGFDVAWMIRHVLEERGDTLKAGAPWLPDDWLDQAGIRNVLRRLARKNGD